MDKKISGIIVGVAVVIAIASGIFLTIPNSEEIPQNQMKKLAL